MILVSDKFKDITGKMFIFVKRNITQIFCIECDFYVFLFLRGQSYLPNGQWTVCVCLFLCILNKKENYCILLQNYI